MSVYRNKADIKYMALNATISFTATVAGILLMTSHNDYSYCFLIVLVAWVGIRDLKAAMIFYQESEE